VSHRPVKLIGIRTDVTSITHLPRKSRPRDPLELPSKY